MIKLVKGKLPISTEPPETVDPDFSEYTRRLREYIARGRREFTNQVILSCPACFSDNVERHEERTDGVIPTSCLNCNTLYDGVIGTILRR